MRKRQLKKLWARLKQLSSMTMTHQELLMKLGAARSQYPAGWRLVVLTRYTEPEPELRLLLDTLRLNLPAQPPPKITAAQAETATPM